MAQPTYVPPVMVAAAPAAAAAAAKVPTGLKISRAKIPKMQTRGGWIYVSAVNKNPSERWATGMVKMMQKDPSQIYDLSYRLAGTEPDVRAALQAANVPQADINDAIARAITVSNMAARAADIQAEMNKYAAYKATKEKAIAGYSLQDAQFFAQKAVIKGAVPVGSDKMPKGKKVPGVSPRARRRPLPERIAALKPDKVLKIMGLAQGKNAVQTVRPGERSRFVTIHNNQVLVDNQADVEAFAVGMGIEAAPLVAEFNAAMAAKATGGALRPVMAPTSPRGIGGIATLGGPAVLGMPGMPGMPQ